MKIQNGISLKPPSNEETWAKRDAQTREAAKLYEAHFLGEMVKAMRKTVGNEDGGLIKKNMAEKIFSEQLDSQYVEKWTEHGGVGLADLIYNQIRDRYFDSTKKDFSQPHRMLPIAPKKDPHGLTPTDSIRMKAIPGGPGAGAGISQLEYRFEVPDAAGAFEARAPFGGKVLATTRLGDHWNLVKLDHGRGLTSEMTFPGSIGQIGTGFELQAGQNLGTLDPDRPVLAWKLDWT